jgi:nitrogen-specific signal transduction histidine kinase
MNQRIYFKIQPMNISLEINYTFLPEENQILLVFKEISSYKKLQKAKTREQMTNIFINSTAHNIFTPINGLFGVIELLQREIEEV